MNIVASVSASSGTELVTLDEIHNVNQMGETSDTHKQLSEKAQARSSAQAPTSTLKPAA